MRRHRAFEDLSSYELIFLFTSLNLNGPSLLDNSTSAFFHRFGLTASNNRIRSEIDACLVPHIAIRRTEELRVGAARPDGLDLR